MKEDIEKRVILVVEIMIKYNVIVRKVVRILGVLKFIIYNDFIERFLYIDKVFYR